jgi:hypothetical protein
MIATSPTPHGARAAHGVAALFIPRPIGASDLAERHGERVACCERPGRQQLQRHRDGGDRPGLRRDRHPHNTGHLQRYQWFRPRRRSDRRRRRRPLRHDRVCGGANDDGTVDPDCLCEQRAARACSIMPNDRRPTRSRPTARQIPPARNDCIAGVPPQWSAIAAAAAGHHAGPSSY